jgi:hypothetical protein
MPHEVCDAADAETNTQQNAPTTEGSTLMLVVRHDILVALVADAVWRKRLSEAKSMPDVKRVISEFTKAKGFVVVEVPA